MCDVERSARLSESSERKAVSLIKKNPFSGSNTKNRETARQKILIFLQVFELFCNRFCQYLMTAGEFLSYASSSYGLKWHCSDTLQYLFTRLRTQRGLR